MTVFEEGVARLRAIGSVGKDSAHHHSRDRARTGIDLFGKFFRIVDRILSGQFGIEVFSSDPRCILRLAIGKARHDIELSGGARIAGGAIVGELHLWNEQLPRIPSAGPNLAWARILRSRLVHSLGLLAREVQQRPAAREIQAFRAKITFVGELARGRQVSRVAALYGFELVERRPSFLLRARDITDTVFVAGLLCAYNPAGLRRQRMLRRRYELWMSRRVLLERYGGPGADPNQSSTTAGCGTNDSC